MQRLAFLSSYRSLNQLIVQVHPSVAVLLLRVPSLKSPAHRLSTWAHLPRVSSLIAACLGCVHFSRRLPSPRSVPPTGFLNLSTVFSASGFAGLFHPATTSRVHAVQGLLSPRSRALSSRASAPLPLSSRALTGHVRRFAFARRRPPDATLVEASASRLSSARGRVADGLGFSLPVARSPLRFSLLQVLNHRLDSSSLEPSARGVPSGAVHAHPLRPPSASVQRWARSLRLLRNQPARDFRAFRLKSPW